MNRQNLLKIQSIKRNRFNVFKIKHKKFKYNLFKTRPSLVITSARFRKKFRIDLSIQVYCNQIRKGVLKYFKKKKKKNKRQRNVKIEVLFRCENNNRVRNPLAFDYRTAACR